jgi:Nuclease A inhibitor-like protein/DNA/RNA non-specific endonuclease
VPARLWKVILVLPKEDAEPRKNTRVIAVILPNNQTLDFNWAKYRVTARAVEELTGYRFFRMCPQTIPPEDRAKFDRLVTVLKEHLSGIKGYKVGDEADRELFIVSKTKEGQWAGLKTSVVET